MKGSYLSLAGNVRFEQKARGCHSLWVLPWLSVVSNSCASMLLKPFLLPSVTTLKTLLSYCGGWRMGSNVTVILRVRNAFFCSSPHFPMMDVACSAFL